MFHSEIAKLQGTNEVVHRPVSINFLYYDPVVNLAVVVFHICILSIAELGYVASSL